MNLLPKSHKDFSSKQYWNTFFSSLGSKSFEWYGEYLELCSLLYKYIKVNDKVLVAGCGNSTLSVDLHKNGFKDLTNVDISEIAIKQMSKKYSDMKWVQADLTSLNYDDGKFSCVLDKGTLDALMTDDSSDVQTLVNKYFEEMSRILRIGGRYVCISLLQEHILVHLLNWFHSNGWMIRVCRCEDVEKSQKDKKNFSFPVFFIVCTKFKQMPNFKPVLELNFHNDVNKRCENIDEIHSEVKSLQHYAILRHNLHKEHVAGENMVLELCEAGTGALRYVLHIIDAPKKSNKLKFAVFIVPQGREVEWMFGTAEGQQELAGSAGASRLIVVHLVRGQVYEGLNQIQDELSSKVLELSPSSLPSNTQVPFLSVGEDLGKRVELVRGNSKFSGDYIVEEVTTSDAVLRRLVFLNNQNVVQSEVKLITSNEDKKKSKRKNKNKKESLKIDFSYLSCNHHSAMTSSIGLVNEDAKILLIGLGGGLLASYIHKYFDRVSLAAVDIDEEVLNIARTWFGFQTDAKLKVKIEDGIDYINKSAEQNALYDIIMFDVDSKDTSLGLSCPPKPFVEKQFLDKVAKCLSINGLFVLNVVCRDEKLKQTIIEDVRCTFPSILCQPIPQELNNVLFCKIKKCSNHEFLSDFKSSLLKMNSHLSKQNLENVDIDSILSEIKIL